MSQRILVFDSDTEFADQVRINFEALGATVDVVDDGPKGIERASEARPDLILLSIELSGMNGFLVCKKIKKSADLKDVPLMILSSEATEPSGANATCLTRLPQPSYVAISSPVSTSQTRTGAIGASEAVTIRLP